MVRNLLRAARLGEDRIRQILHLKESQRSRERAAQKFWTRQQKENNSFWWHLRGSSVYSDQQWLAIGQGHVDLYTQLSGRPVRGQVAEWGCGGGANAVAFAKEASNFHGVEVSAPSLDECEKQMTAEHCTASLHRVLIDIPSPEQATEQVGTNAIDLFVSFYVFEVFPGQQYTQRVLQAMLQMIKPGGQAFIQVKYQTDDWKTRSREWGYSRGAANMTTFQIDQFWQLARQVGFAPLSIHLVPKAAEVNDERYAYFLLEKPTN